MLIYILSTSVSEENFILFITLRVHEVNFWYCNLTEESVRVVNNESYGESK